MISTFQNFPDEFLNHADVQCIANKLLTFDIRIGKLNVFLLFRFFQGEAFNDERPCSPPETGGTLQWGCFNCWDYDR